ncbi:kinase-like protein [Ceratobasidium sp. AG-I]|nr:kinase-like protein [Ceratobasidium sp. AG-I]
MKVLNDSSDASGTPEPLTVFIILLSLARVTAQRLFQDINEELHTWSNCRHLNVLPLLGLVDFRNQIGLVICWMENGSLPTYLYRHPEVDRCQMCAGMCEGLAYLHSQNIVHGNLRGLNVLVSDDRSPMLTNVGGPFALDITKQSTKIVSGGLSIRWAAPEFLDAKVDCSFAADVYALGMTILEIITGKVPYSNVRTDPAVVSWVLVRQQPPPRPEDFISSNSEGGNTLWSLLTSCWMNQAEHRISADYIRDTMNRITEGGFKIFGVETAYGPAVSSIMSAGAVISKLGAHGCQNITNRLNPGSFGHYPISTGGFGDVYRGRLFDQSQVAVKTMRIHVNSDETKKPLKVASFPFP